VILRNSQKTDGQSPVWKTTGAWHPALLAQLTMRLRAHEPLDGESFDTYISTGLS